MAEEEKEVEMVPPPPEEASPLASVAQSAAQDEVPPSDVWTHPEHVWSVLFATFCKLLSTLLACGASFEWLTMPWLDQENKEHALTDAVCDTEGYCMLLDDAEANGIEDSGHVSLINQVMMGAHGADAIDFIPLLAFWGIYLATGKVKNCILNTTKWMVAVLAFFKKVAGWLLVMNQSMITKTFSWGTHEDDRMYTDKYPKLLKLQTLTASLFFYSFCFDIVCFCFLIVASDNGLPGMSHRKRLAMEEDVRLRMESLEAKILGNRKSYAPDNQTEHNEHLERIASSVSQKAVSVSVKPSAVA